MIISVVAESCLCLGGQRLRGAGAGAGGLRHLAHRERAHHQLHQDKSGRNT